MSKILISENGNYSVYAELTQPISVGPEFKHLRFYAQWHDNTEMRFEMVLTPAQIQKLKEMLSVQ
jgi:hypothetical protein